MAIVMTALAHLEKFPGKNSLNLFGAHLTLSLKSLCLNSLFSLILRQQIQPKSAMEEVVKNWKEQEVQQHDLPSILDGVLSVESEKLLSEMEPKIIPTKRKTVTFAFKKQKRRKKAETICEPSPSRYKTRPTSQIDEPTRLNEMKSATDVSASIGSTGTTFTPRRSPRLQCSPTDSASRRITRSSKLCAVGATTSRSTEHEPHQPAQHTVELR